MNLGLNTGRFIFLVLLTSTIFIPKLSWSCDRYCEAIEAGEAGIASCKQRYFQSGTLETASEEGAICIAVASAKAPVGKQVIEETPKNSPKIPTRISRRSSQAASPQVSRKEKLLKLLSPCDQGRAYLERKGRGVYSEALLSICSVYKKSLDLGVAQLNSSGPQLEQCLRDPYQWQKSHSSSSNGSTDLVTTFCKAYTQYREKKDSSKSPCPSELTSPRPLNEGTLAGIHEAAKVSGEIISSEVSVETSSKSSAGSSGSSRRLPSNEKGDECSKAQQEKIRKAVSLLEEKGERIRNEIEFGFSEKTTEIADDFVEYLEANKETLGRDRAFLEKARGHISTGNGYAKASGKIECDAVKAITRDSTITVDDAITFAKCFRLDDRKIILGDLIPDKGVGLARGQANCYMDFLTEMYGLEMKKAKKVALKEGTVKKLNLKKLLVGPAFLGSISQGLFGKVKESRCIEPAELIAVVSTATSFIKEYEDFRKKYTGVFSGKKEFVPSHMTKAIEVVKEEMIEVKNALCSPLLDEELRYECGLK